MIYYAMRGWAESGWDRMGQAVFGPIDQIGYVVDDLDRAVAARREAIGLGPWTIFRGSTLLGEYRGRATSVTMDVALAYSGTVQIELIEVRGDTPSPYADERGPKRGAHHVAWIVDDLDKAIERCAQRRLSVVFAACNDAIRVAYLEHSEEPGALYELIEGAQMRAMIATGIAATAAWDGRDAVTEIDLRGGGRG